MTAKSMTDGWCGMNATRRAVKILQVLILVLLCLLGAAVMKAAGPRSEQTAPALSRYGSTGAEVKRIQQKLAGLGIYRGAVDGIYGASTRKAVTDFQKSVGLTADGIAGGATLTYLGLGSGAGYGSHSQSDYYLIARTVSAEARGEPYTGQVAVGAVILNRVESPSFPNTVSGVVYQPGAFSCLDNGQFDQPVAESCYRAARDALNGWDPTNGSLYYYNPATAKSTWIRRRPILLTIGRHVFCK